MMTPEDHKRLRFQGATMVAQHLIQLTATGGLTTEAAESYAAGVVEGVRNFLTAHFSDRVAYDTLQAAADATGATMARDDARPKTEPL